jgi:hypothetical protein
VFYAPFQVMAASSASCSLLRVSDHRKWSDATLHLLMSSERFSSQISSKAPSYILSIRYVQLHLGCSCSR